MSTAHHEIHFEAHIVRQLTEQGWLEGDTSGYDTERTLYPEDVLAWIEATQPEKLEKLRRVNGKKTEQVLLDRLAQALDQQGLMDVLRKGFSIAGCKPIAMSQQAPEDERNQTVVSAYRANRLRVVRQLKYNPSREYALDLGFFINGLPVATGEVKTTFTQAVEDAINQYKRDRQPRDKTNRRDEKLFTPGRGAVVHFAISEEEVWMTTALNGENTRFLPFNKGNRGRAGNPPVSNGYPVAYLWREVLKPDAWLRIFHSFVYTERKSVKNVRGGYEEKRTLIFPRYHQWEAVNKMIADAHANGPGMNYLCEHSAGSGKTATIAWTAHDLIKLRSPEGESVFDSVIIVTDRTVLDDQLQAAVKQIDHQFGVISDIRRERGSTSKSQQLARSLKRQDPIIVVTIQTFPYAMEMIASDTTLADKHFAVIIDEAHNSQTGSSAAKLQATLSVDAGQRKADMTVEEILELAQRSRKRPANVSHFAFTATPKHSTFMLFGRPADPTEPADEDNLPQSFHRYPMRQAIDEGYILDVLQNYTPYSVAFRLSEAINNDPEVDKKAANRALAHWMNLHPTNVTQKVEFIVEHFAKNVAHELHGEAKAMVVTSSRAAAVRYKKAFDRYIEQHPEHQAVRALVAFSGSLSGGEVNHPGDAQIGPDPLASPEDAEYTEANMNPDARGQDLRVVFDEPGYRVMLVANKFQTGFDQPKLVAMYVDKKIGNEVEIVQTFSRLNRTYPGKERTFIVDFVNEAAAVQKAFKRYDAGAAIDAVEDPNTVHTIKGRLDQAGIYDHADIEAFAKLRAEMIRHGVTEANTHEKLYTLTQRAADTYNGQLNEVRREVREATTALRQARADGNSQGEINADHRRKQAAKEQERLKRFKSDLGRFVRQYGYISQLIDLGDADLEAFAGFAHLLAKRLDGVPPDEIDVEGLALTGYGILPETGLGEPGEPEPLGPTTGGGTGEPQDPRTARLSEIIKMINETFGDLGSPNNQTQFVNSMAEAIEQNPTVVAQIRNNTQEQALQGDLPAVTRDAATQVLTEGSQRQADFQAMAELLLGKDSQAIARFNLLMYQMVRDGERVEKVV